jgi:vacuolar protein sorting-associated protein 13A/C
MVKLLLQHYVRGVLQQVHKLAGSMAAIGNPVDLASNVGGGIKDFFYEPIQGAVVGPGEFFRGARRGVKSLGTGVVHGVTSSVAGVGNTFNRNLGMLTFDNEYQQRVSTPLIKQRESVSESVSVHQICMGLVVDRVSVLSTFL